MLEQMPRLCEATGLQKPSCYQGDYNLVTRGMETKLLPILRAHGMAYNAFRWVRPGLLANPATFLQAPQRKDARSKLTSTQPGLSRRAS